MKKLFSLLLLVAFAIAAKAQVSFLLTSPACHNDGVLSASYTGFTAPIMVKWYTVGTSATTIIHTGVTGGTDVLTGYSGGPINIAITDGFGHYDTGSYAGMPPFNICPLVVAAGTCPAMDTLTAAVCGGGTAPFHYEWYDIATSGIVGTVNPIPVTPGNIYGVTVTDAAGCTYGSQVDYMQIYAYVLPSFSDSVHTTTANCTNGTASSVVYNGGVAPFTYLWSTGATTAGIGSLVTGTYMVTVTDAVGCTATAYGFVQQSINITAPVVPTPASCAAADGSVIAFGSGGTAPYTYIWSNGATTQSQIGIRGGFYSVNVTDAKGCIGVDGGFVGSSTPIVTTYTTTPSMCTMPTGTATLTISGGTAPYTTTWYTTPVHTGITATSLISGNYYYRVLDAAGCEQSGYAYVPPISVVGLSFLSTPATCTLSNGNMTVYPTGGATPYTYSWNTGATTATLSGKPSGNYTVTVTDHVGCKTTKTQYLTNYSPVGLGVVSTPATCIYANDGKDSAVAWGGTPPYSYGWSSGGTTRTITGLPTGPYWVHVTDAAGCTSFDHYSYVGYDTSASSCYCTIDGTVYHDANADCIMDAGETGLANIQIKISGGPLGTVYTYTDAKGYYSYKVPSGTYTISQTVLSHYPLSSCQMNNLSVTALAGVGCLNTVNFADSMDTVHDMHISTWDYLYRGPVPGHMYSQVTIVSNDGSMAEDSVLITYKPDGQLYWPSFVLGGYFSGASYYYTADSMPSMAPGTARQFFMNYNVPPNTPIGTNILFKDTVANIQPSSNWATDNTPWNNVKNFSTTVVGTMDPNFKEVSPKGTGTAGTISYTDSVLEYMVHFQNTGNWMAENITVVDTLDDNLDWTTMRPVFTSAPCKVNMTQSGTRKIVTFTFSNINLTTKSSDEMLSNGMFTYTIHIKSGLATGTQFRNRASIYFDYNAPMMTNTTLNTLGTANPYVHVNNVTPAAGNTFSVYPNPADKNFNAVISTESATVADMIIADVAGRTILSKTIALQKGTQTIATDISNVASGVYFVSLVQNGATQTVKLVVMK